MMDKLIEQMYQWIALNMPRQLAKWAFLRVAVNDDAQEGSSHWPSELTVTQALGRWKA